MPEQQPIDSPEQRSHWSIGLILVLVGLVAYAAFRLHLFPARSQDAPTATIDRPLAALELQGFTGTDQSVTLSDLQGHVTLVNFWATWCSPCRQEFPHLLNLEARFHGHPEFRLLSVVSGVGADSDPEQSREEVSAFLRKAGAKIPTYIDPTEKTHHAVLQLVASPESDASAQPKNFPLPVTILVDRKGIVRNLWLGYVPDISEQMGRMVAELLEEK